jgi:hypothetical protein
MNREHRGRGGDHGYASPGFVERKPHEPTPQERATWGRQVASNVSNAGVHAARSIEAMSTAHAAGDRNGYETARADAETALATLQGLEKAATELAHDVQDPETRAKLEQATRLVETTAKKLADAPPAPALVPPTLDSEVALLAVLPPIEPVAGARQPMFEMAAKQVRRVFLQMPFSDFEVLDRLMREFPDHEVVKRLRRFNGATQMELLALLHDPKTRARARAIQVATTKQAPTPPARTRAATSPAVPATTAARDAAGTQPLPKPLPGDFEAAAARPVVESDAHGAATAAPHGTRTVAIGPDAATSGSKASAATPDAPIPVSADERDTAASENAERDRKQRLAEWRRVRGAQDDDAISYAKFNSIQIRQAIVERLSALEPPAHPAVTWHTTTIGTAVGEAIDRAVAGADFADALFSYLHPADPKLLVDRHRPLTKGTAGQLLDGVAPVGPLHWRPEIGTVLAFEAERRLRESLERMTPRYAMQVEAKHPNPIEVPDLVTSHPMDRVAARLLCDQRLVRSTSPSHRRNKKPQSATRATLDGGVRDGVTFLRDWRWLGEHDPALWHWIEVKEPRHATAEDVAATLYLDVEESQRAYAIIASPPYFRIPPNWAEKFEHATMYKPAHDAGPNAQENDGALALASSTFATEAAIGQAAPERQYDKRGIPLPPDFQRLTEVLDQSHRQLGRARQLLIASDLWQLARPASAFVAQHREQLLSIPEHRLIALTPVFQGQQEILFEAVGAIAELAPLAAETKDPSGIITAVMRSYATAIGESYLLTPARAQLAKATTAKAEMSLQLMEQSALHTRNNLAALLASSNTTGGGIAASETHVAELEKQVAEMRARFGAGKDIDPDDALLVNAELKEEAVLTRGRSIFIQLDNLAELASASVAAEIWAAAAVLKGQIIDRHKALKASKLVGIDPRFKRQIAERIIAAASETDQAITTFVDTEKLQKQLPAWVEAIEDRAARLRAFEIASAILLLVGTSLVGMGAGTVVSAAVRGTLLADAAAATIGMTWGVRVANATGFVAGLATDSAINAGMQVWQSGGNFGDAFAENMITNAVTRVALAPIHKALNTWGGTAALKEVENLGAWERSLVRGKSVLKVGLQLKAEMITGIAVSHAVHRIQHGTPPDDQTLTDWLVQGASMGIGSFMGRWTHGFQSRVEALVERSAHLRRRASHLKALALKVERAGNADGAMELLVERHELLVSEEHVIREMAAKGKLTPQTASTMLHGNDIDRGVIASTAMKTMPLRLNGLQPDDVSETTWTGSSEDIAIALRQAAKSGLDVEVLAHDTAARQWRVRLGGDELTIIETKREGQPRAAKEHPTDADRKHAIRYAESAVFMHEKWLAMTKAQIDARAIIEYDHLQIGYGYAGVVNQSTMPTTAGSQLVVFEHSGTLSKRGNQELGQGAGQIAGPGVRTTEQTPEGAPWIQSDELGRALDVGRIETQTPAYNGKVLALERRPPGAFATEGANGWKAPHRMLRVKVRDAAGTERWFYADRYDNAGGLGPGNLKAAKEAAGGHLEPMLASGQVLRADDPAYMQKLRGGRTLVWGGSPSGAWAAEPAALPHGAEVTILGDTRQPADWPTLLREYEDINFQITTHVGGAVPESLAARKQAIEKLIVDAHSATSIRRNTKPGAPYAKHPTKKRAKGEIQIEFGTPSKIEPTDDGRVRVTVGTGENAHTTVFDQVVVAHGQDPGAPGAPGGLLGEGAQGHGAIPDGEVPKGTIALRPIYAAENTAAGRPEQIVGLESIDPPGIRLLGAAYASPRMAPWVDKPYREKFVRDVKAMADERAVTRDHGKVSDDSRTVSAGFEVQRDQIPRGNEVLAAKSRYRLPSEDHTLALDPHNEAAWDGQVRDYFADLFSKDLRADAKWVRVERRGGGRSKALVYQVFIDGNDVGTYKVFDHPKAAAGEQKMLKELAAKHLTLMTPVGERGVMKVNAESGYQSALLMDSASGEDVKGMVKKVGDAATEAERSERLGKLKQAARQVAMGLAEMHQKFESGGLMTKEAKLSDANYFLDKSFRDGGEDVAKVKSILGDTDFARVKAQLEGPLLEAFLAAKVPATAYHGDANTGNFFLDEYKPNPKKRGEGTFEKVSVIDVGSMQWSLEAPGKAGDGTTNGNKTGAADVARFLGSLETLTPGALAPREIAEIRREFEKVYYNSFARNHHVLDRTNYAAAEKWYRIEIQVTAMRGDPSAKARLLDLVGPSGATTP